MSVPLFLALYCLEAGLFFLIVPWTTITLLLVAVPLLAALITSTATRAALRFGPVRVSTATFE